MEKLGTVEFRIRSYPNALHNGKDAIAWVQPGEGIYIIARGMRTGRGPFKDISDATTALCKEYEPPCNLWYYPAEEIPDRYWPKRAGRTPKEAPVAKAAPAPLPAPKKSFPPPTPAPAPVQPMRRRQFPQ